VISRNDENRRALRKLALQACPAAAAREDVTHTDENKTRKGMLLIATLLVICLLWLTYSHWMQPAQIVDDSIVSSGTGRSTAASVLATGTGYAAREGTATATAHSNHAPQASRSILAKVPNRRLDEGLDEGLEARVEPVEALARSGDPNAAPAVLAALQDDDARVRSRAMDAAVNAYVPIPESTLIDRAQSDPSADVRFLALAGIAARIDSALPQIASIDPTTAKSVGRLALNDASEHVRWQAQQILDTLDANQPALSHEPSQAEVQ
jgi:hypothetical protein